eukprot:599741-Pleurochrysis_carterae.AAC.1
MSRYPSNIAVRLFSVLTPRPISYPFDLSAPYNSRNRRRVPFISSLACTVPQIAVASHAYSGSAHAPLPKFWSPRSAHGRPRTPERPRPGATP